MPGSVPTAAPDMTLAFLRDPYGVVGRTCDRLGTDAFRTRLALRPIIFMRGAEAAAFFYDGDRFGRRSAMPPITVRLLQDKGSVQALNGAAHRHRKALFMEVARDGAYVSGLQHEFARAWDDAEAGWLARGRARLLPSVNQIISRAAADWMGFDWADLGGHRLAGDLDAMINNAAGVGPRAWVALMRRRRCERAVRRQIVAIRNGSLTVPHGSPAHKVAFFRDDAGDLLAPEFAAVEALNLLRPILAVARFIVNAAQTLERNPGLKAQLRSRPELVVGFVEEVRRRMRFFPVIGGTALRDLEWRGTPIPEGTWVMLALWATSNDPRAVADPARIDPARGQSWREQGHQIIPQGAGEAAETHRCPGEWVTVALMSDAVNRLLELDYRVDPRSLTSPRFRYPPAPRNGFVMHGLTRAA